MTRSKEKIIIGSLQFSPIYKSHCCAFGALAERNGFEVRYLFNHKYRWMLPPEIEKKTFFVGHSTDVVSAAVDGLDIRNYRTMKTILSRERPEFIYMYNFHPFFNYYLSGLSRKLDYTYIQHIHEPFYKNKKVYEGSMQYWLHLFEFFQGKLLEKTDVVVISSQISLDLFRERYRNFKGRIVIARLMYEDLGAQTKGDEKRECITLIGPPSPAKGPEIFLQIADYAEKQGESWKFILISRQPVLDPVYYRNKNLTVYYKDQISDEEIGGFMQKSIAVITPYKAATQSSVVVTSNMYGTPILSSNVGGLPEFVHHKETGYIVDINAPVEEWIEGIRYISAHLPSMSVACRQFFVGEYSNSKWQESFDEIFRILHE